MQLPSNKIKEYQKILVLYCSPEKILFRKTLPQKIALKFSYIIIIAEFM